METLKNGKKLGIGFGIVLALLIVVGGWSIFGIGNMITSLNQAVQMNNLSGELLQREIEHLNWAAQVSILLTDESMTKLKVQTDSHKCAFGKWYYGEGRNEAIALIPELETPLAGIESHHNALHQSAIHIDSVFDPNDTSKAAKIYGSETAPALSEVQKILGEIIATTKTAAEQVAWTQEIRLSVY